MLLDQYRASQGTFRELPLRITLGIKWSCPFLLFDANQHLSEEEAFQFLPRGTISTDAEVSVQA